ncbi:GyrI-like domain-containing protein [Agromyces sp. CF514]|uniref:GyrI-like domain-containing protein n=1 Tax=Agromyces sp. CF514 TaxID=1881031 RepID=UPI000B877488|nr:GyrI-like domain-containing protein [Agromyces sp. CF514]
MTEPTTEKYDVKRAHRALYAPSTKAFVDVDVPPMQYLAVDGHGDPNTSAAYVQAVEALFGVAYALKFASRREVGRDFTVAPLEGLWRADDPAAFVARDKSAWSWTMLVHQPEWIDESAVADAVDAVRAKGAKAKSEPSPALDLLRLVLLDEGRSVQILHVGSYDDEAPTLARLHDEWMPQHGLTFNGPHHEIYLSDARRTAPEKLRTVLRQPVRRV